MSTSQQVSAGEAKAQELRTLLENLGYEVEYEQQIDGWHFALTTPGRPRSVVIFTQEVLADWTARQILQRLEHHNWQIVLGANKGQSVLRYSNQGFQANAR